MTQPRSSRGSPRWTVSQSSTAETTAEPTSSLRSPTSRTLPALKSPWTTVVTALRGACGAQPVQDEFELRFGFELHPAQLRLPVRQRGSSGLVARDRPARRRGRGRASRAGGCRPAGRRARGRGAAGPRPAHPPARTNPSHVPSARSMTMAGRPSRLAVEIGPAQPRARHRGRRASASSTPVSTRRSVAEHAALADRAARSGQPCAAAPARARRRRKPSSPGRIRPTCDALR